MADCAACNRPIPEPAVSPTKSLADIAFLLGFVGYEREANACVPVCRDTAKDCLLMEGVVNLQHGQRRRTRLMHAAGHGKVERVHWLLQCNARTNLDDSSDRTALQWAYKQKQKATARVLCARGDFDVVSVLKYTAWLGLTDMMNAGLAAGGSIADVEAVMRRAAGEGDRDALARLLAVPGVRVHAAGKYGRTALMEAAGGGHAEVAHDVLQAAADVKTVVNTADEDGRTALMHAAEFGRTAVIQELLTVPGVDVNLTSAESMTALMYATVGWHTAAVRLLAVPGTDVNVATDLRLRSTALLLAARNGHSAVVPDLLAVPGADVNVTGQNKWTALLWAAHNGHTDVVGQLLAAPGVAVNAADAGGLTALMLAAMRGHTAVVRALLAAPGVDVNAANKEGTTALMIAAQYDYVAVVHELLRAPGVTVNAVDHNGWTALMWAAQEDNTAVVRELLAAPGVNASAKDERGKTALMYARQHRAFAAAQLLAAAEREAE